MPNFGTKKNSHLQTKANCSLFLTIFLFSFSKLFYKVADATERTNKVADATKTTNKVASPQEQPLLLCETLIFMSNYKN